MLNHHDDAMMTRDQRASSDLAGVLAAAAMFTDATPDVEHEIAVDYILDDCFFAVGQGVQDRKTVTHGAIIWWRDRYRTKFLETMSRFGNRWLIDRSRVSAMCRMIGDRAVHYAASQEEIDLEAAMKASADIEKFCVKHATRRSRRLYGTDDGDAPEMLAGYWCTP